MQQYLSFLSSVAGSFLICRHNRLTSNGDITEFRSRDSTFSTFTRLFWRMFCLPQAPFYNFPFFLTAVIAVAHIYEIVANLILKLLFLFISFVNTFVTHRNNDLGRYAP